MVTDGSSSYRGDHFVTYINIELLCYIPETKIILYIDYTSIRKGITTMCALGFCDGFCCLSVCKSVSSLGICVSVLKHKMRIILATTRGWCKN